MSKKVEEIKSIMVACYKCGWSFSSDRGECPMCGANIILKHKELVRILGEYIERQGLWSSKKECSKFIKRFKKNNKRLPNLNELWDAAVDFAKIQKMDKKELKKLKEKQDIDLKKQMEKIKKRKLKERASKEKDEEEKIVPEKSEKEKRLEELKRRRESVIENIQEAKDAKPESIVAPANIPPRAPASSPPTVPKATPNVSPLPKSEKPAKSPETEDSDKAYVICPTCGTKNPLGSKFCMEDGTPLE